MKIIVNLHNVEIVREQTEPINELEVNVSKCEFEFDERITNEFVKEAYFTLNGSTYKQIIVNNECDYPSEVLTEKGTLEIGVVAYKVENNEELIRYNPSPDYYDTWVGSLKDAENTEPLTPTDKEQMQSQISQNTSDISDLQANKQDKLTAGDNITIDENNVISATDTIYDDTEIKADIQELQETKIDKDVNNLTYYTLTTETGSKITLSIDSSTYVMTLKLKDKNNNDISTANVDLPLETMVVGARYDSATKEIILTLKNGQEVRFSVADLVSGLQTEITENNKLSSDLVDDTNNTNKFVSASEKEQITTNKNDITAIKDGQNIDSFSDVETELGLKEDKSNKTTTLSSSSTDTQYPSAKCVYDSQEEQNEQIAELEMLYNAFPTVSAENETIQLDNTAKVKFREIDLKGNTSQVVIPEEQGTSVSNTSIYVSDVNTDKEHTIEMSGNTYQETTSISGGDEYDSPSPEHPQNIEVVTGQNDITICGKNLFDKNNTTINQYINSEGGIETRTDNVWFLTDYIPVIANENYTYQGITFSGIAPYSAYYDKNKNFINTFKQQTGINTITIPNNAYYVRFSIIDRPADQNLSSFMIEKGSTATTYEAYTGTTYPINLGNIELCKISTYQDKIYKKNDKWYLEKYIEKNTVNGTETWIKSSSTLLDRFILNVAKPNMTFYKAYSNYFINTTDDATTIKTFYMDASNTSSLNGRLVINFSNYGTTTLEQFKTWLSNNNVNVYFVPSNTPTTTEITDTTLVNQLNALYNATIYPITNINTDTSNLLPYIDLHYNFVTPSPSPNRPSVVNVVKGNNTIIISNSDNTESQVFPINLGDMELCKIGTYQDYIYESNGNWFKKGNIGKTTLNGTEDWTLTNNVLQSTNEMPSDIRAIGATMSAYSSHFEYHYYATSITTNIQSGEFGWNSGKKLTFKIDGFTTEQEYTNWLGNNNVSIYYQLATPTDTQITDTTLITQLKNIKKAYSYDTQTNISQTNTDKPFIIYAEAIRSLKDVFE